jgi:hypothetical protein
MTSQSRNHMNQQGGSMPKDPFQIKVWPGGVNYYPLFFTTHLKILFIVDSSVKLDSAVEPESGVDFDLLQVVTSLRQNDLGWWANITVDVAQRGTSNAGPAVNPNPGNSGYKYTNFDFLMPGFDLNNYHQVWFFGFQPGNANVTDADILNPNKKPLSNAELLKLSNWMNAGGGVFATGDHDLLGASIASRIPRVRTMRRWTQSQGVPTMGGLTRNDTNQPATPAEASGLTTVSTANERDAVPQPMELVRENTFYTKFSQVSAPHPLLCTPDGVIEFFPDHPHEGEVIDDNQVQLDLPLDIPGVSNAEYPGGSNRPTPKVIAYGRTTHTVKHSKSEVNAKRFGLIGVYDGQKAGVGRVVVDSTWHHWLTMNIKQLSIQKPDVYLKLRHYYRNIALWLATEAQRNEMLTSATWGVVIGSGPMAFPPNISTWTIGGQAFDAIGRTVGPCMIYEWIRPFIEIDQIEEEFRIPFPPECLSCPPLNIFERFVIGGLAKGMLEVSYKYQTLKFQGNRVVPDGQEILQAAISGVQNAQKEMVSLLEQNAKAVQELARVSRRLSKQPKLTVPKFDVQQQRFSLEAIQITDAFDPDLTEDEVSFNVQLLVDNQVTEEQVFTVKIPEPDRRGIVIPLKDGFSHVVSVFDGAVVEVRVAVVNHPKSNENPRMDLRGGLLLNGHPDSWIGKHRKPGTVNDQWRVWWRSEQVKEAKTPSKKK